MPANRCPLTEEGGASTTTTTTDADERPATSTIVIHSVPGSE